MNRFLFYICSLLFFEVSVIHFPNYVFAEEDDDEEESDENGVDDDNQNEGGSLDTDNESEITRVHSIVDGLLRINKHVEPNSKDPKIQKLMKEQGVADQIKKLRDDLNKLSKESNNDKSGSKDYIKTDGTSAKNHSKKAGNNSRRSNRKYAKFYDKRNKIYTVKDIRLSNDSTNRYINKYNQLEAYKSKYLKGKYIKPQKTIEYRVKSFDKQGKEEFSPEIRKMTTKSDGYFGCNGPSSCSGK